MKVSTETSIEILDEDIEKKIREIVNRKMGKIIEEELPRLSKIYIEGLYNHETASVLIEAKFKNIVNELVEDSVISLWRKKFEYEDLNSSYWSSEGMRLTPYGKYFLCGLQLALMMKENTSEEEVTNMRDSMLEKAAEIFLKRIKTGKGALRAPEFEDKVLQIISEREVSQND